MGCTLILTFIFYAFKPCWLLNQVGSTWVSLQGGGLQPIGPQSEIVIGWFLVLVFKKHNNIASCPWVILPAGSLLLELDPWCGIPVTLCMCFLHTYLLSWFPWPPEPSQELICPVCADLLCVPDCRFWCYCSLCQLISKATLTFVQWSIFSKFLFCWTRIRC